MTTVDLRTTTSEGLGPVGRLTLQAGVALVHLADRIRERKDRRLAARQLAGVPQYDLTRALSQHERDRAIRQGAFLFRGLQ